MKIGEIVFATVFNNANYGAGELDIQVMTGDRKFWFQRH